MCVCVGGCMWVREKKGRIERDVRWGGVDLKGKGGGGGGG